MKPALLLIALALVGCSGTNNSITPVPEQTLSDDTANPAEQSTSEPSQDVSNPGTPVNPDNSNPDSPVIPASTPDNIPLFPETLDTPAPANISLAIYSGSTAELNWTRPLYGAGIQTNEILRDGELIATIPGGGNSFVDNDRVAGQGYHYEIVAINRFGRASSIFIDVGISTQDVNSELIDESGLPLELRTALDTTFDLFSGAPFKKIAATLFRLDDPVAIGLRLSSIEPSEFDSGINQLEYACPRGGTWHATEPSDDEEFISIRAVACGVGPITLSGRGSLRKGPYIDGTILRFVSVNSFDLFDARDNSRITLESSFAAYDDDLPTGFARGSELSVTGPAGDYKANNFNLVVSPGDPTAITLDGEGVLGGLASDSRIRLGDPLLRGANGYPASGAVIITKSGTNNEIFDIVASNGNPATFTLTASINGASTAYEIPWSADRNIGDLDLSTMDIGF